MPLKTVSAGSTRAQLASEMVGRPVILEYEKKPYAASAADVTPRLAVDDLWVRGDRGRDALRGVSLQNAVNVPNGASAAKVVVATATTSQSPLKPKASQPAPSRSRCCSVRPPI